MPVPDDRVPLVVRRHLHRIDDPVAVHQSGPEFHRTKETSADHLRDVLHDLCRLCDGGEGQIRGRLRDGRDRLRTRGICEEVPLGYHGKQDDGASAARIGADSGCYRPLFYEHIHGSAVVHGSCRFHVSDDVAERAVGRGRSVPDLQELEVQLPSHREQYRRIYLCRLSDPRIDAGQARALERLVGYGRDVRRTVVRPVCGGMHFGGLLDMRRYR